MGDTVKLGYSQVAVLESLESEALADNLMVDICGDVVRFSMDGDYDQYAVNLSREEAITTAKAILKHFGEE